MATMDAVNRAAQTGGMPPGPQGPMGGAGSMPPGGESMPGGGIEMLAEGVQALNAFITAQRNQGNPVAAEAEQALQALVQALAKMGNPSSTPDQAIQDNQQQLGVPAGATVL